MMTMLHRMLCLGAAFAALAAGPAAAQLISYQYDGVYAGSSRPAPGLSEIACPSLPLTSLEIRNGILRAYDDYGRQTVKGFVAASGFFNADYYFPGAAGTRFEGRIDANGRLAGGIISGGCAWIVDLRKSGPSQKSVS